MFVNDAGSPSSTSAFDTKKLKEELIELNREIILVYPELPSVVIDRYVKYLKASYLSGEKEVVSFEEYHDTKMYEIE